MRACRALQQLYLLRRCLHVGAGRLHRYVDLSALILTLTVILTLTYPPTQALALALTLILTPILTLTLTLP